LRQHLSGISTTNHHHALDALAAAHAALLGAHADAKTAAIRLRDARQVRAVELAEKIADAMAHCERLSFIVVGDLRGAEATQ
jgi:hypothetical protein